MSAFSFIRARLLQRVLCLLLCVCSWGGPVPILHSHESLRLMGRLDQHLSVYHRSSLSLDSTGLHWHFASLRDIYGNDGPNGKSEADGSDIAVFACVTAGLRASRMPPAVASGLVNSLMDARLSFSGTPSGRATADNGPRSFLVTRLQSVSMQQITMAYVV